MAILSAALSLAQSMVGPTAALDVVAITAAGGYVPLFPYARPLAATVYELADLMEHPIETGAVIADHIVFKPVEIELPLICTGEVAYRATYALLRATFLAGTLLTVRTRTGSYSNLVIVDLPHEETADIFNGVSIRMRLREAKIVTPSYGSATSESLSSSQVQSPQQASTTARGTVTTTTPSTAATTSVTSTATDSAGGATASGSTLYQWVYG